MRLDTDGSRQTRPASYVVVGSLPMTQGVRVRCTKWGGLPHWEFDTSWLGEDEHGFWLAMPSGTLMARPGAEVVLHYPSALLVPRDEGFTAMFMARTVQDESNPPVLYVDVTTIPEFDGRTVMAVDLELDVIRLLDSSVHLDDENEFEEHRVRYKYPADLGDTARAMATQLVADLTKGTAPFERVADSWLRRVSGPPLARP